MHDVNHIKAILIGIQKFDHFSEIEPAYNNLLDMESTLGNPKILGLPKENIHKILNKRNDQILAEVKNIIKDPNNINIKTLIVYYVGHGKTNHTGKLYLTGKNTDPDILSTSAIFFNDFKDMIEQSHIQRRFIFLDACYSGIAAMDDEALEINGSYIITSSERREKSFFDPHDRNTFFTKELINSLNKGISKDRQFLPLDVIYNYIQKNIKSSKPRQKNTLNTNEINLFKNIAYDPDHLQNPNKENQSNQKNNLKQDENLTKNSDAETPKAKDDKEKTNFWDILIFPIVIIPSVVELIIKNSEIIIGGIVGIFIITSVVGYCNKNGIKINDQQIISPKNKTNYLYDYPKKESTTLKLDSILLK